MAASVQEVAGAVTVIESVGGCGPRTAVVADAWTPGSALRCSTAPMRMKMNALPDRPSEDADRKNDSVQQIRPAIAAA